MGKRKSRKILGDRIKEKGKYAYVIGPVRDLVAEHNAIKGNLRSIIKRHRKDRRKKNKLSRMVERQGQYIQLLKEEIKILNVALEKRKEDMRCL